MNSLAIIGQGSWGQRIVKALQNSFSDAKIEVISSREFLKTLSNRTFEAVWIAGRPIYQVKTLEIVESKTRLVILEKPLADKMEDYYRLEDRIKNSTTRIDLSRPWCFSNTWLTLKEVVNSWNLIGSTVTFKRSGPKSHSYMAAIEDWLPHDIYLASEMFPRFEIQASIKSVNKNIKETQISLNLQQSISLNFHFTESEIRKSKVEIVSSSGTAALDFLSRNIMINGKSVEVRNHDCFDEITRNFISSSNCDNNETIRLLGTQKWIKSLI